MALLLLVLGAGLRLVPGGGSFIPTLQLAHADDVEHVYDELGRLDDGLSASSTDGFSSVFDIAGPLLRPVRAPLRRSLRLSRMITTLTARGQHVEQHEMNFIEAFSWLVQDELDRRRSRLLERRFTTSGLPARKDLKDFDWSYNPKIPKRRRGQYEF